MSRTDVPGKVQVADEGPVRHLTLERPARRNALDAAMMHALAEAVRTLPPSCRLVVVRGAGKSFCAGADLHWMGEGSDGPAGRANGKGPDALAALFAVLAACDRPLLVVAHGAVRGGGCGLVAVADVALASASASFGFPEVRLGLSPAVIAPHVLQRMARGAARAAMLLAEPFDAARAHQLGLVDEVVADTALEARVSACTAALLAAGPVAAAAIKGLLRALDATPVAGHPALAAATLARLRRGKEAAAGVAAFLARRPAPWAGESS